MDRLFSVFRTSSSALAIQRQRVGLASENLANIHTTRTADGPYRPKRLELVHPGETGFRQTLENSVLELKATRETHRASPQLAGMQEGNADLSPEAGVREEDRFRYEYDPHHPDADENGMVRYPDIDMIEEMTGLISANRLYEANLSVIEAEKEMIRRSFEI